MAKKESEASVLEMTVLEMTEYVSVERVNEDSLSPLYSPAPEH